MHTSMLHAAAACCTACCTALGFDVRSSFESKWSSASAPLGDGSENEAHGWLLGSHHGATFAVCLEPADFFSSVSGL